LKATNCTFQEVDNIFCLAVKNVIRDDVWHAKTSNAHRNSAAHIQEKSHHILQCQLQDGKYYLPPGMCNLWPSIHRRN
jgi:hypothetical protein